MKYFFLGGSVVLMLMAVFLVRLNNQKSLLIIDQVEEGWLVLEENGRLRLQPAARAFRPPLPQPREGMVIRDGLPDHGLREEREKKIDSLLRHLATFHQPLQE